MKYLLFLFVCLLIICCSKNDNLNENPVHITTGENKIVLYSTVRSGISMTEIWSHNVNFRELPKEEKGVAFRSEYFDIISDQGTFCLTNIINNNVDVKNIPSVDGKIIDILNNNEIVRVIGFSGVKENYDNTSGNWINIMYQKTIDEYIIGWVLSENINIGNIEYTQIQFVNFEKNSFSENYLMRITHIHQENEPFILSNFYKWNDNYYVVWGPFNSNNYHYSSKPGVYTLNTETSELRHVTYLGSYGVTSHAWTIITEDSKYLIQDSGTSAGVRGITAWRLHDFELVYSGGYYYFIENNYYPPIINNNIIEVVYMYNEWSIDRGNLDEELVLFGQRFKEENPIPIEESSDIGIIIRCSFNLDTGERKILMGDFIRLE
ncbi:MAG: hypothetical protein FWD28_01880 [Treponema sp.]|nr:hypothetical protein [Treponema sp.]